MYTPNVKLIININPANDVASQGEYEAISKARSVIPVCYFKTTLARMTTETVAQVVQALADVDLARCEINWLLVNSIYYLGQADYAVMNDIVIRCAT